MATKTILTSNQQNLLDLIGNDKNIYNNFYLGGGTALAEFYLQHRYSEDLYFFSEKEFDTQYIFTFFKKIQKKAKIKKIDYQQSFNRNLFFLHLNKDIIKTEFTYYPFPRIEKKKMLGNIQIDSLIDIAVNKIFTIYQKPRSRDFIDLYLILEKEGWIITNLIKQAKIKFDWHVDPLQLGTKFLQAKTVKDYPKMIKKIQHSKWQNFFLEQAKLLNKEILK